MSTHRIYLFKRFERFWHWSQAALVVTMLYTGFTVHGLLPQPGFRSALLLHEVAAWLLVTLWTFAVFWHFTTGEWKQYVPSLERVPQIARYYAWDMFFGAPHPYHVTAEHKHNPLQRLAYLWLKLMINPLLWVSGVLLLLFTYDWMRVWPAGLSLAGVAWVHTAGAYMMLTFFIAHVYLATTGRTPFSYIQTMITGWESEPEDAAARPPQA
jgi:thiosulfate reductase cytochrome b subunit